MPAENMEFEKTLRLLISEFHKSNIRYCLIGGFALGLWSIHSATEDLDFMIFSEHRDSATGILTTLGYHVIFESENVLQFQAEANSGFIQIDFLLGFRERALKLLERAAEKPIWGGKMELPVAIPEDLIGL